MPITVFRVQDKQGRGPWKPGFSHKWIVPRPDHDNLVPIYVEFPGIFEALSKYRMYGSACISLKGLRRWFSRREYKTLKKFGYRAVIMPVDSILVESDTQCLFSRECPLNQCVRPVRLY